MTDTIDRGPFALGGGDADQPATAEQLAAFDFEPWAAEDAERMYHDFSAGPWAAEFADHGRALRITLMLLTSTKEKLVETTDAMESEYSGDGAGPPAEIFQMLKRSRERLDTLSGILKAAEARQAVAAAVV